MTKVGLYAIGTSTTLESNKSHVRYFPPSARVPLPPVPQNRGQQLRRLAFGQPRAGCYAQLA